jgi:geranylgeranyl pyrophosphate synthase
MMQQRIRKHPYLEVFDGADPNATTAVRPTSTTPIQALWMLNNELAHTEAVRLAERLSMEFSDETARISRVIELVLCRPAEEAELQDARHYLAEVSGALDDAEVPPDQRSRAALGSFTRVLFSTNEFVFVD